MSAGNGKGKILSLGEARHPLAKDSDLCTVKVARQIAADEASKVHEWYLKQIPDFVARMVHDALVGFGLIEPPVPADAPPLPAADSAAAQTSDAPPAQREAPGSASPPAVSDA